MELSQIVLVAGLIAVTIPLVVSLFAAFDPQARVRTVGDYFLYAKDLDLDGFLKASIGYSLQAASIALFFLWAVTYGARPIMVAIAWAFGYFFLARCVRKKKLDRFLTSHREEPLTIHGFVGKYVTATSPLRLRLLVMLIATATIIGLGGTMIVEVDYSTKISLNTIGISAPAGSTSVTETVIHVTVLIFTLFYVIWGGYRAVVLTERYQVPAAYIAFVAFGVGVLVILAQQERFRSFSLLSLATLIVLLSAILWVRLRLFGLNPTELAHETSSQLRAARIAAWMTFLPLVALTAFALVGCVLQNFGMRLASAPNDKLAADVWSVIWPDVSSYFGFGVAGAFSLLFTNALWQIIDISSLQRLQSVSSKFEEPKTRESIAKALEVTGVEAGIGWALIILIGLALRALGVDKLENVGAILLSYATTGYAIAAFITPVFLFAVSVFMLSTISGFMSALSYVAFYDIVGVTDLSLKQRTEQGERPAALGTARQVTFIVIVFLYIAYSGLKAIMPDDKVSAALYAIYAFQLTILPLVTWVFFASGTRWVWKRTQVRPSAAAASIILGFIVAWITATQPEWLAPYIEEDSNYVIPPLAVIIVCCAVFFTVNLCLPERAVRRV
jgi:hypothetical protein